jgi:amino acid transporter
VASTHPDRQGSTIDGWVRDPAIRLYSLIALAMLLVTLVTLVVLLGVAAAVVARIPAEMIRPPAALAGAGLFAIGFRIRRWHRNGRRRHRSASVRAPFQVSATTRRPAPALRRLPL